MLLHLGRVTHFCEYGVRNDTYLDCSRRNARRRGHLGTSMMESRRLIERLQRRPLSRDGGTPAHLFYISVDGVIALISQRLPRQDTGLFLLPDPILR